MDYKFKFEEIEFVVRSINVVIIRVGVNSNILLEWKRFYYVRNCVLFIGVDYRGVYGEWNYYVELDDVGLDFVFYVN